LKKCVGFLAAVETLLLSAARRGLYSAILVSVLAPALLPVVLFSIPDFRSFGYGYADGGRAVLALSSAGGESCYPAGVVESSLAVGNMSLRAVILVVDAEPSRLLTPLGLMGRCNGSTCAVLPREVYEGLGKPRAVMVLLDQSQKSRECAVAGPWDSNVALLAGTGLEAGLEARACLVSQEDILLGVLRSTEEDLLSTAALWAIALSLAYMPVLYTAQRRVAESLRREAGVLLNCGVSRRTVLASTAVALALLHVFAVLYVGSLGVVLVYTAWSLLRHVVLPPALRWGAAWLLAVEAVLGALTAYPASRGVAVWR